MPSSDFGCAASTPSSSNHHFLIFLFAAVIKVKFFLSRACSALHRIPTTTLHKYKPPMPSVHDTHCPLEIKISTTFMNSDQHRSTNPRPLQSILMWALLFARVLNQRSTAEFSSGQWLVHKSTDQVVHSFYFSRRNILDKENY